RPYLFSNTLAPPIVAGSLKTLEMIQSSTELRDRLEDNTKFFRQQISQVGLDMLPGTHPIVPVMFYDAKVAAEVSHRLLERGVYVIAFSYPVVPQGQARIRTQVSAGHTKEELQFAADQFAVVKAELGL